MNKGTTILGGSNKNAPSVVVNSDEGVLQDSENLNGILISNKMAMQNKQSQVPQPLVNKLKKHREATKSKNKIKEHQGLVSDSQIVVNVSH